VEHFCHGPANYGIKVDKPDSNNGTYTVTWDWKATEKYDKAWWKWYREEKHTPEVHELWHHIKHFGDVALKEIAAGQINVVKNLGKLIHAFTRNFEPGSNCDSEVLIKCLDDKHESLSPWHEYKKAFVHECARVSGCEWFGDEPKENHYFRREVHHEWH